MGLGEILWCLRSHPQLLFDTFHHEYKHPLILDTLGCFSFHIVDALMLLCDYV